MNQGKLEVVKQEMARVNVYILGIRELKWTGMGKFNSDGHYVLLLCARIPWKKGRRPHSQQRGQLKCSTWVQSQRQHNDLCFRGKTFNITVIQVYSSTINAKEAELNESMKTFKNV